MPKYIIIFVSFLLIVCCKSRNEYAWDSDPGVQQPLAGQKNISTDHHQNILQPQDTVVYEQPQVAGGYLYAPETAHQVLWGNKNDKPVVSADQDVVFVSFIIEPDSTASAVRVLRGIDEVMDEIAVQAVKEATWKPGLVNNQPVRSRFVIPVVF